MKLVEDTSHIDTQYYWVDEKYKRISPIFHSDVWAEIWYFEYKENDYEEQK